MRKYLILGLCAILCFSSGKAYSRKPDEGTIARCNLITNGIYNDLLKIQNKYFELENFDKEAEKKDGSIFLSRDWPKIHLQIIVSPALSLGSLLEAAPDKELRIKELKVYLSCRIRVENPGLKDEVFRIIDKNVALVKEQFKDEPNEESKEGSGE